MPTKEQPLILLPYFMLKGVAEGFFWSTRHTSFTCLTNNKQRDRFLLSLQVGTVLVSVIMPILAGLFMHFNSVRGGYSGIYVAAAGVAFTAMILGPCIVTSAPPRPALRKFRTFICSRSNRSWRTNIFFSSINGTLALFSSGVVNVGVLKTEFNVGIFTSSAALLAAVFILNIRRITFVALGSFRDIAGRFIYTVFLTVPSLLFKTVCDSFLSPLRSIFSENIIRKRSDMLTANEGYTALEPFLFQELYILIARLCAFTACAVIFTFFPVGPFAAARYILFILVFAPLLDFFLINRIEKEFDKPTT